MTHTTDPIVWRLHLRSSPEAVYRALDSDEGRQSFWAESARERSGVVEFLFANGTRIEGRILERSAPLRWSIDYFGSVASFELIPDGHGGTDLVLANEGVPVEQRCEVSAGWLNVLLPMKAAVDHGIDLRNHDSTRSWDRGYVDQ